MSTSQQGGDFAELPEYQCHKKVRALKIAEINEIQSSGESGKKWVITPSDEGYGPIGVSDEYVQKHKPKVGGYYVVYEDGYKSFSPAEPFESGYTLTQSK